MARHLRREGGGNPAQGPVRELANEPPSPRSTDDFPDAPDDASSNDDRTDDGGRGDLDPERTDDVAERLGLIDDETDDETDDPDDDSTER